MSTVSSYARIFRTKLAAVTGAGFERIAGYVVTDNISRRSEMVHKLGQLERENLYALSWPTLLGRAKADLHDFNEIWRPGSHMDLRLQEITATADPTLAHGEEEYGALAGY